MTSRFVLKVSHRQVLSLIGLMAVLVSTITGIRWLWWIMFAESTVCLLALATNRAEPLITPIDEAIDRFVAARRRGSSGLGKNLAPLLEALFSKRVVERVFAPAHADLVHEWHRARADGSRFRAAWIKRVLGPYVLVRHAVGQLIVFAIDAVFAKRR